VQPPTSSSPNLAALLGLIPGVGAFYNGEYAKGFVHVMIFATLIWMADHVSGLFGIAIAAFYLYMPIEAYKTARAREMGLPSPDPFGFNNLFGTQHAAPPPPYRPPNSPPVGDPVAGVVPNAPPGTVDYSQAPPGFVPVQPGEELEPQKRIPTGAFILIGLGVLLLLNQLDIFHFDWGKFWPLILIFFGVVALYKRQRAGS
jgi:TM2 domain-containing membrane protein YozV